MTGTRSIFVCGTSSRRGQSKFVQLVDEQFVDVVRFVLGNAIPNHNADDEEGGGTTVTNEEEKGRLNAALRFHPVAKADDYKIAIRPVLTDALVSS